jgi:putative PEP-CTERM system TPR-repeat lipoprotein
MSRRLQGPLKAGMSLLIVACLAACSKGPTEAELLESARALLAKNDAKGAVIQLKSALQKDPQLAQARLLLGRTLLGAGDPTAALVELTKAQELQVPDAEVVPDIARALLLTGDQAKLIAQFGEMQLNNPAATADLKTSLATAQAVKGNKEDARKALDEALRVLPGYAPAIVVQARLAASEGQFDDALALLNDVLTREPTNEQAGLLKGELLWQVKNDRDGALEVYRKVVAARPEGVAGRAAVANILFQQNKVPEAKTEVEALKKVAPNHPETLYLEAQLAFSDKDFKTTREITSRILKGLPDNVGALKLAGAAEYRMKDYVLAEAYLGRALKNGPRDLLTRQLLAQTYLRSAQPAKAVEVLQPVLDSTKPDGASLALAGEAYLQQGDSKRSEEAFQRAVKVAPTDARVRTSAAVAQMARGNNGEAITELEAIVGTTTNPRADLALVSARLRQNDLDGALKAIDALQKKQPDEAYVDTMRGRVLALKRDLPGASKSFEAAIAKDANYFPAVASLAAIDLGQSKPDAARQRFDDFIKAHPKNSQAVLALAELNARTGATPAVVTGLLKDAAKLNPSEPTPHLILINRLIGTGDGKGALVAAQDASAALPNNLEILDALGRAQMAAGDNQRAVSTFKRLAGLQPSQVQHAMRLAEAYIATKDNDAAARELKRALEIKPGYAPAQRGLASLAMSDSRPQDALNIALDMQKRNPKEPAGFILQGDVEASRKNWDAAAAAYRAGLQRGKLAELAVKLHSTLNAAGKKADAERVAADWLKDNPKDVVFRYYLGDQALAQNDLPRAEAQYRSVVEIQPEHALALNNIAWLLVKSGKPGALALAEKANALLPDRAPLLDTLSMAQEADNQVPKAIESQKRAIQMDPNDASLTLRLAKLYIKAGDKARARAELEALAGKGDKYAGQAEVATLLKSL